MTIEQVLEAVRVLEEYRYRGFNRWEAVLCDRPLAVEYVRPRADHSVRLAPLETVVIAMLLRAPWD